MAGDPRPATRRVAALARNVGMLAATAGARLEDDPVRLAVLAVRRLPLRARRPVAAALVRGGRRSGRPVLHGLGLVLADRPDEARSLLGSRVPPGRLAGEIAVELGLTLPTDASAAVRARRTWQRGDLAGAVEVLRSSDARGARRQAARLESERRTYLPGQRLAGPPPGRHRRPAASGRTGGVSVLHLLTNSLPWTQSGYALRSHGILRAQRAAGARAEAVTRVGYPVVVGLPWAAETDVVDGVPYHRLIPRRLGATPEARLEQAATLLAGHVDRAGADVLHTTTHYVNGLVAEAVARSRGVPWVYEMRGQLEKTWLATFPAGERETVRASERYRLWRAKEVETARAADHVVALSQVLRRELCAAGVDPARVSVVPNAVDAALVEAGRTSPAPPDARRSVGLPEEGMWVGTVSSLVTYEGLDILLHAVARLRREGLDVRCAIVGDGSARAGLVRLAGTLGLDGAAVLPGRVDRSAATAWVWALDLVATPRRDTEVTRSVTPLKPVEAMALGRPVVVSDLPALAEVVGDEGAGLLVTPEDPDALADTIRELYADPLRRSEIAGRGREVAATRTWQEMARRYLSVYQTLGSAR
ncbi:glycosyltransferase [Phycicoccus sp. CSK15P-2]|uniref:glycosyltransferase family 4 protein n=1 Tax=Phycicoccus sp. CSK15P-2 TaxID=2807627 RepID=UPI001951EDAB|nr:glycosyltransferase family 4 protein [Phycicoccus sp. CSK15P-2]MBM6403496.1 glycosyltransferase [Phycicoccus sp. CSK15P-2]